MKILVTGGTGYIGSHTVVELIEKGFDVIIVDNLSNSSIDVLDAVKKITGKKPQFEQLDLCEPGLARDFFGKEKNIDAVIHFAAFKAVSESQQQPLLYYKNNLVSMINLLECMEQQSIPHLVFSSSCTVYGQPDKLPVTENDPIKKASSVYGNTKQVCEQMLVDLSAVSSINTIALRYFNPIGAHASSLIGELPNGIPNNLVPFITQTAIGKRKVLSVFGGDYNTPDGSCIRDFIHVVDLAKAHVIAIERLLKNKNKKNYEIFNIGTGNGYSVLEVIKSFEKCSGQKLNYEVVGRRAGDIEKIFADTTFANQELGWKATKSLDEMVSSAWEWEKHLAQD